MIRRDELDAAIAECIGERDPTANTCIKLAAYYILRKELYPEVDQSQVAPAYSFAAPPAEEEVHINSDSEFARAVEGLPPDDVWGIVDELVQTVQVLQPRVYAAVIRKLDALK